MKEDAEEEARIFFEHCCHAERDPQRYPDPLFGLPAIPGEGRGRITLVFNRIDDRMRCQLAGMDRVGNTLAVEGVCKSCRISSQQNSACGNLSLDASEGNKSAMHVR